MKRRFLIAGAVFGLLAVIIGAFATHGLQPLLSESRMTSFETGVKYQMYHALLLLLIGSLPPADIRWKKAVFYLLIFGIICFSGTIFLLATNDLTAINFTTIALVTPFGGTLLIAAWMLLLISFVKLKLK